ncbi:MAG: SulP family inorganic anion transporter [Gammaproteobacteria bacterium]|nr:MAG: SulP family inorganic anion transporter [Gammaproteobacteria bacterium]
MLVPFSDWIGEIRHADTLRADLIAGITVALVLVPQSMAYAQLAGLPPYIGLYASFIPVMIAAFWGSSRQLATGPVAVVSLMTAAALGPMVMGMDLLPEQRVAVYLSLAALLAIMVGIFQMLLGVLRLGVLVDFLSHPVVVGFTNGAAIIIATSQLSKLFGVTVEKSEHHYETVWRVVVAATTETHVLTLIMGIVALAIMILLKKYLPKIPTVLTAVVITTVASWMFGFQAAGGKVVGEIPEGLPGVSFPEFDLQVASKLVAAAITISLIGFMEAIAIAKAMAAQTRQRLDTNQELFGQGFSNITAGLFGAYPVSGSFSRSAVNIAAGARTGFSSVVTGSVVAITLLFLTPLLYHLPQATLAAVIIMAVINLVKVQPIKHAMKVQKHDGVVSIITFALTLIMAPHLEKSIIVGVLLSLGLYLYRSMRPRFAELSLHSDGTFRDADVHSLQKCKYMSVLRFDGSLYFANAGYFETRVLRNVASKPDLKFLILDLEGVNEIDATGEEVIGNLHERLGQGGVGVLIARTKRQTMQIFERSGLADEIGREHFFRTRTDAIEYARGQLGEQAVEESPLNPVKSTRRMRLEPQTS